MTKKIFIILLLCFNWCGFYTIISQNKYSDYLFDKEDNLIINDSNINKGVNTKSTKYIYNNYLNNSYLLRKRKNTKSTIA